MSFFLKKVGGMVSLHLRLFLIFHVAVDVIFTVSEITTTGYVAKWGTSRNP